MLPSVPPPFDRFYATYSVTAEPAGSPSALPAGLTVLGWQDLMSRWAGATFADGVYRLHDADTATRFTRMVGDAFPEHASAIHVFAGDWLGRQFALDRRRVDATGEPQILLLEPGTGEALEIPVTFATFHDEELVDEADAAVAASFFAAWKRAHPELVPLEASRCVGYRVPLFLGGSDDLDNLGVCDVEVYWGLTSQLRVVTRSRGPGTPIRHVGINDDGTPR